MNDLLARLRATTVATCVKCGTKGSPSDVFHLVDTGDIDRPDAAIPVKAGKVIIKAWTCKHCPKD